MVSKEFIERPYKNEKESSLNYVQNLLFQAREDNRIEDIERLEEIIRIIKDKKYGLVWEKHKEIAEEKMKTNIPVFVEDESRKIIGDPNSNNYNFILEGDNLHSLHILEKTHLGMIDIIYIDPPYNTKNSLTYNDSRVSETDNYRHSKWLSFMERRLKIARSLLNEQGLIFISIDDNEGYNLKLLCDDIFGECNFMGTFSVTKSEGGGVAKFIVKGHDLVLVYAKNLAVAKPLARPKDIRGKIFEKDGEKYWIQEDAYRKTYGEYGNLHYEEILEYKDQSFKDDIDNKIKSGEVILIDKGKEGHIIGKVRKLSEDFSKYHSVLKELNATGKNDLKCFGFESEFDYPKPVNLIKDLISGSAFLRNKKLTILDFFAGSGTTGQAVLEFIKESGRNDVTFILCTNNEVSTKQKLKFVQSLGYLPKNKSCNSDKSIDEELKNSGTTLEELIETYNDRYEEYGICKSITYPRIKKVIEGFESNFKNKKILYKKKLTAKNLCNVPNYLEEIEEIKKKEEYTKYNVRIDSKNNVILEAEIQKGEFIEPIPANLKYFKTKFVNKEDFPGFELEDELLKYITPLVELEFNTDISNPLIQVVLTDNQFKKLIRENKLVAGSTLYIHPSIFFDSEDQRIIDEKNIIIQEIPDYFFGKEIWS